MPLIQLILLLLDIYFWIIIAMVVMSWLVAFNIVNPSNNIVRQVRYALYRLTEPVLAPIRRFLLHRSVAHGGAHRPLVREQFRRLLRPPPPRLMNG